MLAKTNLLPSSTFLDDKDIISDYAELVKDEKDI